MTTDMKKRARLLHKKLARHPKLASSLMIADVTPLASGTRGVVYATTNPSIVVKISEDEREVVAAKRLQALAHPNIVRVYTSFLTKLGKRQVVFTYLERLKPMSPLRVAAQEYLHHNYKFSYHRPRTMLAALDKAIEGGRAPLEYVPHLRDYRNLLIALLDAREWHRDLKTPNLMIDKRGSLCVTDIGSFTENPLVVIRNPPVLREQIEPLADKARKAGWPDVARKLERIAATTFQPPKRPLYNLGLPDPHDDDSELSDNDFDRLIPEEMVRDLAPQGPRWRQPARHNDVRRQPRPTTDTTVQRWKMNGDFANRSPLRRP